MCISNEVAVKLAQAKQLIEEGWCQNSFVVLSGNERFDYCVIGAMYRTLDKGEVFEKMVDAFIKANGLPSSDYVMGKTTNITSWNDDEARTKEEVLAAFDKATNYDSDICWPSDSEIEDYLKNFEGIENEIESLV